MTKHFILSTLAGLAFSKLIVSPKRAEKTAPECGQEAEIRQENENVSDESWKLGKTPNFFLRS